MDKEVCERFKNVRGWLSHELIVGNITNIDGNLKKYCGNGSCDDPFGKINAGCLYLFDEFFAGFKQFTSVAKRKINIVDYILIWLGYMLNLNKINENGTIDLFYETYINNDDTDNKYNQEIDDVAAYTSYKDLIDKKENLMSIDINDMSKFYDAFILLCDMYIKLEKNSNCDNYLEKAKKFAEAYDVLNEDYYNGEGSPYNQLLSTLSNDYCNLKNKCNQFPTLPTYSRRFVIKRTLIPIAFMIVAVSIFLGIEYKYSSLGFRKRSQKQCLREKIKNIMKKMIH
ncbi:PIR protein [Plasmodium yoelii]|uniref:PIR protein n=2 Tax=Plasmodium yoelii TaxID=5861 RepID=A0AAE9WXL5_PLAYO|nr:PIR protein [Plasmodium yoelii]WBY58298.1 PIR protein [Plasmodium yoelii yoelii]VTZ79216.1 PIR protein [Plasmodium yoelii]|eukprot:XP_034493525.1 PIR protein [Plasmodium yoelii]